MRTPCARRVCALRTAQMRAAPTASAAVKTPLEQRAFLSRFWPAYVSDYSFTLSDVVVSSDATVSPTALFRWALTGTYNDSCFNFFPIGLVRRARKSATPPALWRALTRRAIIPPGHSDVRRKQQVHSPRSALSV